MSEKQVPRDRNHAKVPQLGIEVAKGSIPGYSSVNKFGHADAVLATQTTIWDQSTLYSYLASATILQISSSDVDDTAAGPGARTVMIFGLDADYNEIDEAVILDGRTQVPTEKKYLRIFRMHVMTTGATGYNEGDIYAGTGSPTAGVPPNKFAKIVYDTTFSRGENQTLMSLYTVPAGKTAYLMRFWFNENSAKSFETWIYTRDNAIGSPFQVKLRTMLLDGIVDQNLSVPLKFTEKTDIEMRAAVAAPPADISAGFDLILIDND